MGKINTQKVLIGGLVAGAVMNVIDILAYGVVFRSTFPEPTASGPFGLPLTLWFVIMDFVYGIVLVYLYAAIRPRFGAGPRTAVIAALLVWTLISLLHGLTEAPMAFAPQKVYTIGALIGLVALPLGALAGAKVYTE
ncbi:MAG TPA: hypothetical protein VLB49_05900 [Gemmatimonadales bacterium]|nr:hypothetical protein [Gemmatimonadales bacterium]